MTDDDGYDAADDDEDGELGLVRRRHFGAVRVVAWLVVAALVLPLGVALVRALS